MIRKTFDAKGIDYVSDLALLNVKDLKTIEGRKDALVCCPLMIEIIIEK